jgi:hypothetical protein
MTRLATETAMAVVYAKRDEATPEAVAAEVKKYQDLRAAIQRERDEDRRREAEREQEHRDAMRDVATQDPRFAQALIANDEIREAARGGHGSDQEVRSLGLMWGAFFGLENVGSGKPAGGFKGNGGGA